MRYGPSHRLGRAMIWRAVTLTIFPEMFPGPLGLSLAGKALGEGKWALSTLDIRDFATDKHRSVDDTPAGGGAGMVMRADIAAAAIDAARLMMPPASPTIYLSPRGAPLTETHVDVLSEGPGVILLCGRFEGIDERVLEARQIEEVSIWWPALASFCSAGVSKALTRERWTRVTSRRCRSATMCCPAASLQPRC